MTTMHKPLIGTSYRRREDARLTTGFGQFIADIPVANALHAKFVRSDRAHARIRRIDVARARALPGVAAVLTGEDIREVIPSLPNRSTQPLLPAHYPRHWPLAVGKVRFHGEPVAVVVAEDKYVAADAAELVEIDYEDLPVVTDPEAALKPDAPILHEGMENNIIFEMTLTGGFTPEEQAANAREVDAIFAAAPHTLSRRFRVHRCGVTPLETRGVVADWTRSGLRVWMSTQRPHIDRLVFSDLFAIPQNMVHVSAPQDQGGAFGVKAPVYREPIMIVHLTRLLGRPVRWIESREEHLMAVSQERDQIHDLEIAADDEGRILALRDRILADNGDSCEGVFWGFVMPFYGAAMVPNGYAIPKCDIHVRAVATNKSALSPARAFGTLPGRFAVDRMIDILARKLGKDPAEVRRLNILRELPHVSPTGVHYDYSDYLKVWDKLIETVDLAGFRREQAAARAEGRHIGIGFGTSVHASGVASVALVPMEGQPGYGSATVKIDSRGTVTVLEGDAPQGQGHETAMSQVVADMLGVDPEAVIVRVGDSVATPFASGTFGARGGSYTASAVALAAKALRSKLARIALHDARRNEEPDSVTFAGGKLIAGDGNPLTTFADIAERVIMRPLDLPEGMDASLEHTAFFEADFPMMSYDAVAVKVEADPETGRFRILDVTVAADVGNIINPQIVEGQTHGGIVQGLSNAMFEEFVYDANGIQLSSTLEAYKIANAADVPPMHVVHANTPCRHTPLGTRGMGEGTPGPVPGALVNAICDALAPFAVEIDSLPIRPDRLWQALRAASAG